MVKFAQDDTDYRGILIYLFDLCESPDGPKLNEAQAQRSSNSWMSVFSKIFRKKQSDVEEKILKSKLLTRNLMPAYASLQKLVHINRVQRSIFLPSPLMLSLKRIHMMRPVIFPYFPLSIA